MKSQHADRVQILPSRPGADEIEPIDYLWALWRYRALILAVTLVCGGLAYAISAAQAPVYQASAVVAMAPPGGGELAFAVIVQLRNLLQNASVVERALARHQAAVANLTPGTFIAKNLSIERNRDTNLFSVGVTLPDAAAAADTANFISDEAVAAYTRIMAEQKPAPVSQAIPPELKDDVKEADARVLAAKNALVRFLRESRLADVRAHAEANGRITGDIAVIVAQLRGERAALKQVLSDIASTERLIPISSVAPGVQDSSSPREYLNPLYASLQTRASESRARIASLEEQRNALSADELRFARDVAALPTLELQLEVVQAAYDHARVLQVDAQARLEQAQKASLKPGAPPPVASVSVAERATAPTSPVAPKPARSLLLGIAFGGFTSVLLALALDALRVRRLDVAGTVGAV